MNREEDLQLDLQRTKERDPLRTNEDISRTIQYNSRTNNDRESTDIRECTRTDQRMHSEGSERERVSEASQAPTLCHMPSECVYACRMRRHPDRWHPKRMNPTRYDSAKTSLQFWSCRAKSISKLKWHCRFRRRFLQFRHAKPQETVDHSWIQSKDHAQQCNDERINTPFYWI